MTVTGTTYFYYDSYINGKQVRDMTEQERKDFAREWVRKHGGSVEFIDNGKKE